MATGQAGRPSLGGRAEQAGTKGYADDDTPLRDGHNAEPDIPTDARPTDPSDLGPVNMVDDDEGAVDAALDDEPDTVGEADE